MQIHDLVDTIKIKYIRGHYSERDGQVEKAVKFFLGNTIENWKNIEWKCFEWKYFEWKNVNWNGFEHNKYDLEEYLLECKTIDAKKKDAKKKEIENKICGYYEKYFLKDEPDTLLLAEKIKQLTILCARQESLRMEIGSSGKTQKVKARCIFGCVELDKISYVKKYLREHNVKTAFEFNPYVVGDIDDDQKGKYNKGIGSLKSIIEQMKTYLSNGSLRINIDTVLENEVFVIHYHYLTNDDVLFLKECRQKGFQIIIIAINIYSYEPTRRTPIKPFELQDSLKHILINIDEKTVEDLRKTFEVIIQKYVDQLTPDSYKTFEQMIEYYQYSNERIRLLSMACSLYLKPSSKNNINTFFEDWRIKYNESDTFNWSIRLKSKKEDKQNVDTQINLNNYYRNILFPELTDENTKDEIRKEYIEVYKKIAFLCCNGCYSIETINKVLDSSKDVLEDALLVGTNHGAFYYRKTGESGYLYITSVESDILWNCLTFQERIRTGKRENEDGHKLLEKKDGRMVLQKYNNTIEAYKKVIRSKDNCLFYVELYGMFRCMTKRIRGSLFKTNDRHFAQKDWNALWDLELDVALFLWPIGDLEIIRDLVSEIFQVRDEKGAFKYVYQNKKTNNGDHCRKSVLLLLKLIRSITFRTEYSDDDIKRDSQEALSSLAKTKTDKKTKERIEPWLRLLVSALLFVHTQQIVLDNEPSDSILLIGGLVKKWESCIPETDKEKELYKWEMQVLECMRQTHNQEKIEEILTKAPNSADTFKTKIYCNFIRGFGDSIVDKKYHGLKDSDNKNNYDYQFEFYYHLSAIHYQKRLLKDSGGDIKVFYELLKAYDEFIRWSEQKIINEKYRVRIRIAKVKQEDEYYLWVINQWKIKEFSRV